MKENLWRNLQEKKKKKQKQGIVWVTVKVKQLHLQEVIILKWKGGEATPEGSMKTQEKLFRTGKLQFLKLHESQHWV